MASLKEGLSSLYPQHVTDPDGSVHPLTATEAQLERMLKTRDPRWRAAFLAHIQNPAKAVGVTRDPWPAMTRARPTIPRR